MRLVSCPDCGAKVSDTVVVCAQCGFPLRREVQARPVRFSGGASRDSNNGIVVAFVTAGILVVLILGIIAALAIPRFVAVARDAKEQEGVGLLQQVYWLESTYAGRHSAYAPTLEALKSVGWKEPENTRYYTVEIASATLANLCVNAVPRPGSGVRPIRIRTLGEIDYDARCGEYGGDTTAVEVEAMGMLRNVYRAMAVWRGEHQRLVATEAELVEAYPAAANYPDFVIGLTPLANGGLCVHIAPRTTPPSPVVRSLDCGGNVYEGEGCGGSPVEQLQRY
jgi:Tfp pilus assembly protein PilE